MYRKFFFIAEYAIRISKAKHADVTNKLETRIKTKQTIVKVDETGACIVKEQCRRGKGVGLARRSQRKKSSIFTK